jgi:S-layer homology domain
LRKTLAALFLVLTAAVGTFVMPASARAAETSDAKVVIIVGATHGATSDYRSKADQAYVEAKKYTPNVVKVYSPNATWSKVKSATVGASVVIYLGHGNGWPSPYPKDAAYTTKDGFGLNATAGNGDGNTKYYGEPYVSTLDLAPNAVILLHHLCYASGNSEPGNPAPTRSVAKQRVDNYGAGFLRAGASAVIADGHRGAVDYLRALFTTDQRLVDLWRSQPNYHGNEFSFASARTSGKTALMDPDTSTSGYYRSMVGNPNVTTTQVLDGAPASPPPPPAYAVMSVFVDLGNSKFVSSIQWIYDENITNGCSDTKFCPVRSVTRGEMASFIARTMKLPAATKDYFTDDNGKTHEGSINRIAEAGLTNGCAPGLYCREDSVNRAQMAAFLVRALDLPAATKDYFTDDEGSSLESAINAMAAAGLTSGCGDRRYCPGSPVTREQMAAFLLRAFKPS